MITINLSHLLRYLLSAKQQLFQAPFYRRKALRGRAKHPVLKPSHHHHMIHTAMTLSIMFLCCTLRYNRHCTMPHANPLRSLHSRIRASSNPDRARATFVPMHVCVAIYAFSGKSLTSEFRAIEDVVYYFCLVAERGNQNRSSL